MPKLYPSGVDRGKIQQMVEAGFSTDKISEAVQVDLKNLRKYIKSFGWKAVKKEKQDASSDG